MKKFRYPLERLKQFRALELVTASDAMRQLAAQIHVVEGSISEKQSAIQQAQGNLVSAETASGMVQPDVRRRAGLYIDSVQQEQEQLEQTLDELLQQHAQAHAHLVEKKQSVKMLENHEQRLSTSHHAHQQTLQNKESDELWLTRPSNTGNQI